MKKTIKNHEVLMKSCDKFAKDTFSFWDGSLTRQEHEAIAKHLQDCSFCEKRFALARQIRQAVHNLPKHKTSPHFNVILHARLRAEANRRRSFLPIPLTGWSWQVPAYAAAALFLIAGGIVIDRVVSQRALQQQNALLGSPSAETVVLPAVQKNDAAPQKIKNYVMQPIPIDRLMRMNRRYAASQQDLLERRPGDTSRTRNDRVQTSGLPNINQVHAPVRF